MAAARGAAGLLGRSRCAQLRPTGWRCKAQAMHGPSIVQKLTAACWCSTWQAAGHAASCQAGAATGCPACLATVPACLPAQLKRGQQLRRQHLPAAAALSIWALAAAAWQAATAVAGPCRQAVQKVPCMGETAWFQHGISARFLLLRLRLRRLRKLLLLLLLLLALLPLLLLLLPLLLLALLLAPRMQACWHRHPWSRCASAAHQCRGRLASCASSAAVGAGC